MARISAPSALPITGTSDFFVQNTLDVSGSIRNPVGHLILSSSAGSFTIVSGNLDVLGNLTVDGAEVTTEVTGADNFFVNNQLDARGVVVNTIDHLILSSSGGSQTTVSGALTVTNDASNVFLTVDADRGSTSSSAVLDMKARRNTSSNVASIRFLNNGSVGAMIQANRGGSDARADIIFTTNSTQRFRITELGEIVASGSINASQGVNADTSLSLDVGGTPKGVFTNSNFELANGVSLELNGESPIFNETRHLTLSSSAGSRVTVSGNLSVVPTSGSTTTLYTDDVRTEVSALRVYRLTGAVGTNSSGWMFDASNNYVTVKPRTSTRILQLEDAGGADYFEFDTATGLTSQAQHLILSSSAGSRVTVSGTLGVRSHGYFAGRLGVQGSSLNSDFAITIPGFGKYGGQTYTATYVQMGNELGLHSADKTVFYDGSGTSKPTAEVTEEGVVGIYLSGALRAINSPLTLSSSAGSVVHVSGALEVDSTTTLSGILDVNASSRFRGTTTFYGEIVSWGGTGASNIIRQRGDNWVIGVGTGFNNAIIVTQYGWTARDHDHALQTNPAVFIHSNTDPNIDNTQFLGLKHDQTDAVVEAGSGAVKLVPASGTIKISGSVGTSALLQATDSHLILSSSAGSRVVVSGTLQILSGSGDLIMGQGQSIYLDDDQDTFITADNTDDRIELHTGGSQRLGIEANQITFNPPTLNMASSLATVRASIAHLTLSSSAGSIVKVSGNLKLGIGTATENRLILDDDEDTYLRSQADDYVRLTTGGGTSMTWGPTTISSQKDFALNTGMLYANGSHLELSSSDGSQVFVSGNLALPLTNRVYLDGNTGNSYLEGTGTSQVAIGVAGADKFVVAQTETQNASGVDFRMRNGIIYDNFADLILSSSATSRVHVSGVLKLPLESGATNPALQFGDGDSGFYEATDDNIWVALQGIQRWAITLGSMGGRDAGHPRLMWETASSTNPNLVPNYADADTGLGSAGANQLSVVAGSEEVARATETEFIIFKDLVVSGSQLVVSSSDLLVQDPLIVLALSQSTGVYDSGFISNRGSDENVGFIWDESDDIFSAIRTDETGSTAGNVAINGYAPLKVEDLTLHSGSITTTAEDLILNPATSVAISGNINMTSDLFVGPNTTSPKINEVATSTLAIYPNGVTERLRIANTAITVSSGIDSVRLQGNTKLTNSTADLVLSASTSQVTVSGNFDATETLTAGEVISDGQVRAATNLVAGTSNQIRWLSSTRLNAPSDGAVKIFNNGSTDLLILGGAASGSVEAVNSHLILSSSAGSQVTVSGTFKVTEGGTAADPAIKLSDDSGIYQDNANSIAFSTGGSRRWSLTNTGLTSRNGSDLDMNTGTIYDSAGHLILSSSAGSTVTVSGNLKITGDIIESESGTSVDTAGVIVDTFENTDYRTVKYIVSVSSGSAWFQSEEILLMHSASTAVINEYSLLSLPGGAFVSFEASITGSTVNLIASGSKAENTVKLTRTPLGV
jgi:hypothetical protein